MGETKEFNIAVLENCLNIIIITKALITLIIAQNLLYALIKWLEFYTLCQVLNCACKGKITTAYSTIAIKVK